MIKELSNNNLIEKKQNEMIIIKDNKSQQIIDKYSNFDNKFVISKKEIVLM